MTKQQFDDLYLGKAVHCDTEEKANKFLALAHSVGYTWCSNRSLLGYSNWKHDKTCYNINDYGVSFATLNFYLTNDYEVLEFDLEQKIDLKDLLIKYIDLRLKKLDKLFEITDSELCLSQRWELQQLKRALITNTLELDVAELEAQFPEGNE